MFNWIPTKLIEKVKEALGEQSETGEQLYTALHEVTEKEVLTPEEAKRVIMAARPGLYRTLIQTAIFTGARISELLALKWENVNLDRSTIEIRRTISTAKVKDELTQEKHRWFDPKTKHAPERSRSRNNWWQHSPNGKRSVRRAV